MDMDEWRGEYIYNLQFTYQILMYGILMVGTRWSHDHCLPDYVNSNVSVGAS